jgi:hypothetical protein
VPRIAETFGSPADADPIEALQAWVKRERGRDPGQVLKESGLNLEFWSRIGD